MNMSWKLLFIMLNVNYLIIKLFLTLYLVLYSISIYLYMCVHVHVWVYLFSCFPSYLGLMMTTSLCLFTIIRFNKAYLFYFLSLTLWGFCTVIILFCCTASWMVVLYCMCMYICIEDRTTSSCKTLWFCFSEINELFIKRSPFINIVSSLIWMLHALVMCSIYGI